MIPGLKSITTQCIQSHKSVTVNFPEKGVVIFTGNNSNGKSVIVKALRAIISGDLYKPKERKTLVNKDYTHGSVTCERYDGMTLFVYIHHEAAQTFAELTRPNGEKVRRYLADKSISELVKEFGLHYNAQHDISLNIHSDDERLLFVDTKHATNYSALRTTVTDEYAEQSLANMEPVLLDTKRDLASKKERFNALQAVKEALPIYDVEELTALQKKIRYIYVGLTHIITQPCPKAKAVPQVITMSHIKPPPKATYPVIINLPKSMPDIRLMGRDLNDVLKGVCPTCKRAFFS